MKNKKPSLPPKLQAVIDAWEKEICRNASLVDPSEEYIWQGVFVGFAIGRGLTIEEATDYDLYNKYAFPKEYSDDS